MYNDKSILQKIYKHLYNVNIGKAKQLTEGFCNNKKVCISKLYLKLGKTKKINTKLQFKVTISKEAYSLGIHPQRK